MCNGNYNHISSSNPYKVHLCYEILCVQRTARSLLKIDAKKCSVKLFFSK